MTTIMGSGYLYYRGKLHALEKNQTHTQLIKKDDKFCSLEDAIDMGAVRVRNFGSKVAFQGRSERLVRKAYDMFWDTVKFPFEYTMEWPGRFIDSEVDDDE